MVQNGNVIKKDYYIRAFFQGTGGDLSGGGDSWKKVTIGGKEIEYVVKCDINDGVHFIFQGAGLLNLKDTNVESTVERAVTVISNEITTMLNQPDCNKIYVKLIGHSRGGAACSGVARELRAWVQQEVSKSNMESGKVVITFAASDPYYGPTAKGEFKRASMKDIKDEGDENDRERLPSVVVYATDTSFSCTPQQIIGADVVIIAHCGHNDTFSVREEWEDLINGDCVGEGEEPITITGQETQILKSPVLWAIPRSKSKSVTITANRTVCGDEFKFIAVDKQNVKDLMRCIRKYGPQHFCDRVKVLATVVRKRLKIKLSDENIAEWMPQWTKDLENCLENIDRSRTASEAFNYVFELLNDDKYGLFISKNKDKAINFWYVVKGSYDLVLCGENEQALVVMRDYIKRGPQEFKKRILQKLMQRISEK